MSQADLVTSQSYGILIPIKAPTVVSVAAASGPAAGGTTVVITGTNFKKSANPQATFGGVAATAELVLSATTLQCVTPAHGAGAVNVAVTNSAGGDGGGGLSGAGVSVFTYT
jgi:hypothetical protein